ncbi:MAG: phenylalanine--tRNA ligase subunit beta [Bacillota bacterium]|nr:phenylalanine--tRNA ligase subunit beta [Bacillota bacterium]
MRVSLHWLREFVPLEMEAEELAQGLSSIGLEVAAIHRPWAKTAGVWVGKALSVRRHENSDRLFIVEVDWGRETAAQVVTAAANVVEGMLMPYAPPGACLPDGRELKKAVLRGVASEGMLLSADELALGGDHDGIMALSPAEGWQPGDPFDLGWDDAVLELELTPNYQVHAQSVVGVAREVAALYRLPLRIPPLPEGAKGEEPPAAPPPIEVFVEEPEGARRFIIWYVEGLRVGPSPLWMQRRLLAAGMRPISNVVDISNYLMLEWGQPLHMFDGARVRGGRIGVRGASSGEELITLDGQKRKLKAGDLVIADGEGPVGLAGIMGGENSEVHPHTRAVLVEAAWFNPAFIRRTARRLGLETDASRRFGRGIDPVALPEVARRAVAWLERVAGGKPGVLVGDVEKEPYRPRSLPFAPKTISKALGMDLAEKDVQGILERLQFQVVGDEVVVPPFRGDVELPVDLVEEVARIFGYNAIPAAPLTGEPAPQELEPKLKWERVREALLAAGLLEAVTYSFHGRRLLEDLRLGEKDPRRQVLSIRNPLSESQEILRPFLWPSLLELLGQNQRRGQRGGGYFERARVYGKGPGGEPQEEMHLAFVAQGGEVPPSWWEGKPRPWNVFHGKGLVEALLQRLYIPGERLRQAAEPGEPFLHPFRQLTFYDGEQPVGWVGEVHPEVLEAFAVTGPVVAGEWRWENLLAMARPAPRLKSMSRYPVGRRDVALRVPKELSYEEVLRTIRRAGGALLSQVELFDVYQPDPEDPFRSLAFHLSYQSLDRTLTDEEVAAQHERVRRALASLPGVVLRS